MKANVILVDERTITFNQVEGKEYTKHSYAIRNYHDVDYIKDVLECVDEEEMDENTYYFFKEFLIDGKVIFTSYNRYDDDNIVLNYVIDDFDLLQEKIKSYGTRVSPCLYSYNELLDDNGNWKVPVVEMDTEDKNIIAMSDYVYRLDIDPSDEMYYFIQLPEFDKDNGHFIGYVQKDIKVAYVKIVTDFNNIDNFSVHVFNEKDEIINNIPGYKNNLNELVFYSSSVNIFNKGSVNNMLKYESQIKDALSNLDKHVEDTKKKYADKIINENTDIDLKTIIDSLSSDNIALETPKEELEIEKNNEQDVNVFPKNKIPYTKIYERIKEKTGNKIERFVYADTFEEMFNTRKNLLTGESLRGIDMTWNYKDDNIVTSSLHNRSYTSLDINNDIFMTDDDNRIFIGTNFIKKIVNMVDLSDDSLKTIIKDLNLTILINEQTISSYEKLSLTDILKYAVVFLEITSDKIITKKSLDTLLYKFNLSSADILNYVQSLKEVLEELSKEIIK